MRKAIRLALDYDGLVDVTVGGKGKKQASPIPNGFAGTDGLPRRRRTSTRPRQLLRPADDRTRSTRRIPSLNVYGVDFSTAMQKVQSDLKSVGINAQPQPGGVLRVGRPDRQGRHPRDELYFAPDHTDSSQYVQYFGMVADSQWATWGKVPAEPDGERAAVQGVRHARTTTARARLYNAARARR